MNEIVHRHHDSCQMFNYPLGAKPCNCEVHYFLRDERVGDIEICNPEELREVPE